MEDRASGSMMENARTRPPRLTQVLNGVWDIQGGEAAPEHWASKVPVPGLVDLADPPYDWRAHPYHWYRLAFRVASTRPYARAIVRLEQAMFGTRVFINGSALGGDIACYTSQEYDVQSHLRYDGENELIVRVGARETLPPESAVGKDQERETFIPGIWGDVSLILSGDPRVLRVQMIPHLGKSVAESRVTLQNAPLSDCTVRLVSSIREHASALIAGRAQESTCTIAAGVEAIVAFAHRLDPVRLWSPDEPFLYDHVVEVFEGDQVTDQVVTCFGMREFRAQGADFLLNGERIFLRGGNIAFHRFLSDADRGTLPWDLTWVRKLLIDIPKAHNFNFFRNHIGQLYNRWYDLADEGGMLIQNEWMFWTTTGTQEQITREFTRWLQDNWNHPSIVIWDPLNECTDPVVQQTIVPQMKALDPTRPWESVDFTEDHPYIYSLGPVLPEEGFGFARSLQEIEDSPEPSMVNEFLWWWLDKENNPTALTAEVVERWLGPAWTKEDLVYHQSFLACELVELFRRMRLDAIQPFVYLSNNAGPTGNWFLGDIAELRVKPLLATLKNAFAPFGVSLELWDRHFSRGEKRTVRLFVFNDHPRPCAGSVKVGLLDGRGEWISNTQMHVEVGPSGCSVLRSQLEFPRQPGTYTVVAELSDRQGHCAVSRKPAFVLAAPAEQSLGGLCCSLLDERGEVSAFLLNEGAEPLEMKAGSARAFDIVIVGEGMLRSALYRDKMAEIARAVESGCTLLVLEPEFGHQEKETLQVLPGIELAIERRADTDKGGYDSCVFACDTSHALWRDIAPEHLKFFNGSLGGEIVSQHSLTPNVSVEVLARCGLKLAHPAVFAARFGHGRLVVSRMQTRGRLLEGGASERLYERRMDPVARQLMRNLVSAFTPRRTGAR